MIYALQLSFWVSIAFIGALAGVVMCMSILKGF